MASDDKYSHEAFTTVAEAMDEDYLFGISNDIALAKREQVKIPGIALYKNFDEEKNVLELSHNAQAIAAFVLAAGTPLVAKFHPEVHASYVNVSLHHLDKHVPSTKSIP